MNSPVLFIFGAPRSGTTIISHTIRDLFDHGICFEGKFIAELALGKHSFGDLRDDANLDQLLDYVLQSRMLIHFHNEYPGILGKDVTVTKLSIKNRLRKRSVEEVVYSTLACVADEMGKQYLGNKFPDYWKCLPELLQWFPDAKFLHVCRDGRDVALSTEKKHWGGNSAFVCARSWGAAIEAVSEFRKIVGNDQLLEIKYEDFMSRTPSVIEDLEKFIGLELSTEDKSEFLNTMAKNPLRNNFGKWRNSMSKGEIRRFEAVAGKQLKYINYPLMNHDPNISFAEKVYYSVIEFCKRPSKVFQYVMSQGIRVFRFAK